MAATLSDIQLNIIVNVRNAASLAALSSTLSTLNSRQAAMAKSAGALTGSFRDQSSHLKGLAGRFDALERNYDGIFRASYRLMNVGYQLIGVAKGIFTAFMDLTNVWGKFEFMVNRAAGALQIWRDEASGINPVYEALIQNIISSSKELRLFPAEEVAKATYFWASTSGQAVRTMGDLKQVMESVNPLMRIAALTQTSYEQAIKGTYSIIVQYGKSLSDVDDVTAKLHLVTQRTALEFGDLINSFKYVGPTAHALGISFEEVAQVLGALGDAGIRGSQSGRALRQLFIRLVKPPAEAAAALENLFLQTKSLGKGFDELIFPNGKFVGITEYVNYLAIALKDATVAERNHMYAISSTANELPVLTALVENQIKVIRGQADAYDNAKSSVYDAAGAANAFRKSWDLLANSWVGLTGRLSRGVEVIKILVGRVLADALSSTVERLTEFLDGIERWVRRNPALVRNIGQLGTAIGLLAATAGGVFLLSGALLGLYGAVNVIVRAFAPLAGIAGTVLGGIILLAESIIDNWTRIERVVVPAFDKFIAVITGSTGGISGMREEWADIHSTLKAFVDLVVKQAINAIKMLLDFMTMVAESPLAGVFEVIGKAIVLAFGLRTLAYVTGFAAGLAGLLKILMIVKAGAITTAIQLRLMGASSLFATRGVGGLTVALQTLSRTTVLIILTGVILAFQTLYELVPGVRSAFDGLGKSTSELKEGMLDFYAQIGTGANNLEATIARSLEGSFEFASRIAAAKAEITALQDTGDFFGVTVAAGERIRELQGWIANLENSAQVYATKFKTAFETVAAETERSLSEVAGVVQKYGPKIFGDLAVGGAMDKALGFAKEYFTQLGDQTELTANNVVNLWNNAVSSGWKPAISKEAFVNMLLSKDTIERLGNEAVAALEIEKAKVALRTKDWDLAFATLQALKVDASRYGPEFNSTVDQMLNGIPKTVLAVSEEAVGIMEKTPNDMLNGLITSFKSLGNLKDKFKTALKQKVTAADLAEAILGDINSTEVTTGLESNVVSLNLWAQSVLDNAHASFVTGVGTWSSVGKSKVLAQAIRDKFKEELGPGKFMQIFSGNFKGDWWKKLPAEVQISFQNMVDWAAQQLGLKQPSPAVVNNVSTMFTSKANQLFKNIFGDPEPVDTSTDPVAAIVAKMRDSVSIGVGVVDGFKQHVQNELGNIEFTGTNPVTELNKGMLSAFAQEGGIKTTVLAIANFVHDHLMGNSPPPLGPLSDINVGGYNVISAWAQGLASAIPLVRTAASNLTNAFGAVLSGPKMRVAMFIGGYNILRSWVQGMLSYWNGAGRTSVMRIFYTVKANAIGNSPPPMGPLKDIDVGGYNIMKAWADGMSRGGLYAAQSARIAASQVRSALDVNGMGGGSPISFASSNERLIKVQVDVASRDGSVAGVDMTVLSESLIPELVRSLEHMSAGS